MSFREKYIEEYEALGKEMYKACEIPTVYDFALAFGERNEKAFNKIKGVTDFTGNLDDIIVSCNRTYADYDDKASIKFIDSVIASNVTEIINSGMMYKYCMATCDDLKITEEDCGSKGQIFTLPITGEEYYYKIQNHYIEEIGYTEDYTEFIEKTKNMKEVSVRNVSDCLCKERSYCKKCVGLFRRNKEETFTPKNIGLYATLMVTEKATQASLDSMNKGKSVSVNGLLDSKIEGKFDKENAKVEIRKILDEIGSESGVQSRFYEIILWGRFVNNEFAPIRTAFLRSGDVFGQFIYNPESKLKKLIKEGSCYLTSTKSKIAFNDFFEEEE